MTGSASIISVVIPAYNAEAYVAEAIESVMAQIPDTAEILLVDDGSEDDTARVAKQFNRIRYIHQSNQGPAVARNSGIHYSHGQLITFCDADDLWQKNRLGVQLERMRQFPQADIVLGHLQRFWQDDRMGTEAELMFSLECALIKRAVFGRVGMLDAALRYCEDWDWFLRVKECGVTINIHPEVVVHYRQHQKNMSHNVNEFNRHKVIMLKRARDRKDRHKEQGVCATDELK